MLKKISLIIVIICFIFLMFEAIKLKGKDENLVESSNLAMNLQQEENSLNSIGINIIEDNQIIEENKNEESNIVEIEEKKQTDNKESTTKQESNNTKKENQEKVKSEISQSKEKQEETSKKQNNENKVKQEKTTQNKIAQEENKQQTQKAQEVKTQETVITYSEKETLKIKSAIEKLAKNNSSLFDSNGNKLYKIEINKKAMNNNYFSPFRENQVEAIVLNVFPCTFYIYAVSYEREGYTTEYRYYIGVQNY